MAASDVDARAGQLTNDAALRLTPRARHSGTMRSTGAREPGLDDTGDSPGHELCGRRRDQPGTDHRDRSDALHRAGARECVSFRGRLGSHARGRQRDRVCRIGCRRGRDRDDGIRHGVLVADRLRRGLPPARGASLAQPAVVSLVVFVVLTSSTIAGPVVYYLVRGERAEKQLDAVKGWLVLHNGAVMTVLFVVLGVDLVSRRLPPLGS